ILQADATATEIARRLEEQLPPWIVVEVDAEAVREHELHPAHEVLRTGPLADHHVDLAVDDALPVDCLRIDDGRILGPVGHDLVTHLVEVTEPLLQDELPDVLAGKV